MYGPYGGGMQQGGNGGYPYGDPYGRQQPAYSQPQIDVSTVQSVQQIEQVQVQPGTRRLIMAQNEPVIAMRVADNIGLITTDYYRLEKFVPEYLQPPQPATVQQGNGQKYVTEDQLEAMEARITATIENITRNNEKPATVNERRQKEA